MKEYSKIQFMKRGKYREAFITYSKFTKKFRVTTGVKVLHEHFLDTGGISPEHPTYYKDISIIRWHHEWVENHIFAFVAKHREKPPVSWLQQEYEKSSIEKIVSQKAAKFDETGEVAAFSREIFVESLPEDKTQLQVKNQSDLEVFRHWKDFIHFKNQVVRSSSSLYRYIHMASTMDTFTLRSGRTRLSFIELDQQFFNDFLFYLVKEHEYVRVNKKWNTDTVDIPEIGLSNETAIKQLDNFTEYLKFCKRRKDAPIHIDDITEFISIAKRKLEVRKQNVSKKWELTLTPHELQFVVNLDQHEPDFYNSISENWRRFLDIFLFMCLQGTAPIDTKAIKKSNVERGKLVGERSKNGNAYKVELDEVSLEILKRHNYDFRFSDQAMNEALKKIFTTIFELYRRRFEEEFQQQYEMIYSQRRFKGPDEVVVIMHKAMFVEAMTGRRTFITNINERADELGMRENMKRAGHNKIQTHLDYQHDRQTGLVDKPVSLFDVSRIKLSKIG
ncbi:hypothetical protein SAMN04488109_4021 [Chryseolinea serpens]|uniref:Phage integrase SAM-like domain-containing protein n=1 Tax=Chryseolinea serpens TaxID=947013 RepID=A0A1M5TE81_9BACT|nr:hypothetical protein [Chryseolinea serpens]SHH49018.1 hypothetical protein SAMN04488109_4021 [Chryseolinea serpens]